MATLTEAFRPGFDPGQTRSDRAPDARVMEHIPMFSVNHALKILEVFYEIFEDIPNLDIMVQLFGEEREIDTSASLPVDVVFDEIDSESPVENEDEFIWTNTGWNKMVSIVNSYSQKGMTFSS